MSARILFVMMLCFFTQCSNNSDLLSEKEKNEITKISLYYRSPTDENTQLKQVLEKPAQIRYFIDNFLGKGRKIKILKSQHSGIITLYKARGANITFYIRGGGLLVQTPQTWFVPSKSLSDVLKNLPL